MGKPAARFGDMTALGGTITGPGMPTVLENIAPKDIYAPCFCGSGLKYKFCCSKKDVELEIDA